MEKEQCKCSCHSEIEIKGFATTSGCCECHLFPSRISAESNKIASHSYVPLIHMTYEKMRQDFYKKNTLATPSAIGRLEWCMGSMPKEIADYWLDVIRYRDEALRKAVQEIIRREQGIMSSTKDTQAILIGASIVTSLREVLSLLPPEGKKE